MMSTIVHCLLGQAFPELCDFLVPVCLFVPISGTILIHKHDFRHFCSILLQILVVEWHRMKNVGIMIFAIKA